MTGTLVLSCGGYRSGSTLGYNLLGGWAEAAGVGRRVGHLEPEQVPLLDGLHSVLDALGVAVGKAHHSPGQPGGGDWTVLLGAGRLLPVMTLREPRDVVASFARAYGQTPDAVLASRRWRLNLDNVRWWLDAGALPVAYDDVRVDPCRVVTEVARRLGLPVDQLHVVPAPDAGAERAGREALSVEHDPRTLLHGGHVATPQGGAWRCWPADVLARVDEAGELLARALAGCRGRADSDAQPAPAPGLAPGSSSG